MIVGQDRADGAVGRGKETSGGDERVLICHGAVRRMNHNITILVCLK